MNFQIVNEKKPKIPKEVESKKIMLAYWEKSDKTEDLDASKIYKQPRFKSIVINNSKTCNAMIST